MSEVLSPAQFARLAGIRLDCVYKKLWDGSLPAQKSEDGRWEIPACELEKRHKQEVSA
jgi:hypothetical protein